MLIMDLIDLAKSQGKRIKAVPKLNKTIKHDEAIKVGEAVITSRYGRTVDLTIEAPKEVKIKNTLNWMGADMRLNAMGKNGRSYWIESDDDRYKVRYFEQWSDLPEELAVTDSIVNAKRIAEVHSES